MGQYWIPVNLDKKEYVDPHKLATGLKLWEQLANHPGTGAALVILCAAMPEARGGGDFDLDENWHGQERNFNEHYATLAKRTIGRWAGNRIALVGDYAEDSDLPKKFKASEIFGECDEGGEYKDVSDDVCAVIAHELNGEFVGEGWRDWKPLKKESAHA